MYLYTGLCTWVSYPWGLEEVIRSLEVGVTGSCESPDGCWIPKSGPGRRASTHNYWAISAIPLRNCKWSICMRITVLCWWVGWFGVWESNSALCFQSMCPTSLSQPHPLPVRSSYICLYGLLFTCWLDCFHECQCTPFKITRNNLQVLVWLLCKLSWKYPLFSCCDELRLLTVCVTINSTV